LILFSFVAGGPRKIALKDPLVGLIPAFDFVDGLLPKFFRSINDLPGRLPGLPDTLLGGLLHVTHGLIHMTLGAQFVVICQRTHRFLDTTLHYLC
jgi:hypothetical protein